MPRFVVQEETFLAGMDKKPAERLRKHAEGGNAMARREMGMYCESRPGTKRDISEAIKWYTAAATQGYAEAQFDLGEFYMNGYGGVERNRQEGFRW